MIIELTEEEARLVHLLVGAMLPSVLDEDRQKIFNVQQRIEAGLFNLGVKAEETK